MSIYWVRIENFVNIYVFLTGFTDPGDRARSQELSVYISRSKKVTGPFGARPFFFFGLLCRNLMTEIREP